MTESYLKRLNKKQREAVVSKAKYLQILAGPGSGKTRVLTTRVAHLVLHEKINPREIMVATFTRKAAFEMKERLEGNDLLGPVQSNQLTMGTFHSICAKYLRQYATSVRLPSDFRIIDTEETNKILLELLKDDDVARRLSPNLDKIKTTATSFRAKISTAKNSGMDAEMFALAFCNDFLKHDVIVIFNAYEHRLRMEHLVDFDDLLLYGRQLFKAFPHVIEHITHILVDEYQDTNIVQYDIVSYIARGNKNITIVGDPDQSIYGFRNANVGNFKKMMNDFENVRIVTLEENYRSTDAILNSAYHVIQQDSERIEKGLFTQNGPGTPISLLHCESELPESLVVAEEILRVVHHSKGLIQYKDIAILVRVHYITQNIESALKASGIPYDIIGGVRFFDRMEIKDLVSYVQFIYNPNDTLAFERIINTPRRGVGQVTLEKICALSRVEDKTVLDVLIQLCSSSNKRKLATHGSLDFAFHAKTKQEVKKFVDLCRDVKAMMDNKESVRRILEHIIKFTNYHSYLKKDYKDHQVRWDNVGELMTIAGRYDKKADADESDDFGEGSQMFGDRASQMEDDGSARLSGNIGEFVANTTLDPTGDDEEGSEKRNRVQIMTIHQAKGLEWPCVFIMACEQGIIPHIRAEQPNEEARLLYVAMTRAKYFLYITYGRYRSSWATKKKATLSFFLENMPVTVFQRRTPAWNDETRSWISHVLRLPTPALSTKAINGNGNGDDDGDSDATTVDDDDDEVDDNGVDGKQVLVKKQAKPMNPDDHPGDEFPNLDAFLEDGSSSFTRSSSHLYEYDSEFGISSEEEPEYASDADVGVSSVDEK